jgi:hypothetical protein
MNAFEAPAGDEHSVCPSPEGGPRPRPAGILHWQQKQALKRAIAFSRLAHETFALLSTQPRMGWPLRLRNPRLASLRVFRISGFEKMLVLCLHVSSGVEISGNPRLAFHRSPTNVRAATTLMAARPDHHTVLRLPAITAAESWWWSSSHCAPVGSLS